MRDSPDIFAWTCGLLLLLLGVAFSLELRRWLRRRTIITWRHMVIRALSTAVLGLLLVKLIWGAYHVGFNYSYHPDAFLQFWSRCLVLAYLALMSAAVDAWLACRARRAARRTRRCLHERLTAVARECFEKPGNTRTAEASAPAEAATLDNNRTQEELFT